MSESFAGSPPRGRGRLGRHQPRHDRGGLTPAWAGTTDRGEGLEASAGAHPRVGGDDLRCGSGGRGGGGSPPRGRGRRGHSASRSGAEGLTPAWAGTTRRITSTMPSMWAHPRVGGDDGGRRAPLGQASGSPPRGRGRLLPAQRRLSPIGLTPAWAGTTLVHKAFHEPLGRLYITFRARTRRLAALQPGRIVGWGIASSGRRIRVTPS